MAQVWDATFHSLPLATEAVSSGDDRIRALKDGIEERMANEHDTYVGDGTAGNYLKDWIHKQGSARAFFQDGAPATQINGQALDSTDYGSLWFDDDNDDLLYYLQDDTPTWVGVIRELARVSIQGTLATGSNVVPPIVFPRGCTVLKVAAKLATAPTGTGDVQIDLEKNGGGNSIFGTNDYIELTDTTVTTSTDLDGTNKVLAADDYLEVDIDSVGGTVAGADLSLTIEVLVG